MEKANKAPPPLSSADAAETKRLQEEVARLTGEKDDLEKKLRQRPRPEGGDGELQSLHFSLACDEGRKVRRKVCLVRTCLC